MHCPFDEIGYLQSQFVINHLLLKFGKSGLKHAAVFWGKFYTGGSIDKIKEFYEYNGLNNRVRTKKKNMSNDDDSDDKKINSNEDSKND